MDSTSELGLPVFLILCGVLGMLLLAIGVIVFFMIYQKRLFAQQENIRKMEKDYQKDMLQYSFEAQEAERKRIAYDLHDDIGSILSTTRIYAHQLNPDLPKDNYNDLKSDFTNLIDNAIDQIRIISHNLYPPNLEHLGFIQACEDLCQRIQKVNGLVIEFDCNVAPEFTKQEELYLYRILQELTNNTIKHAQATRIMLHFNVDINRFEMMYQDNGVGFIAEKQQYSSNGLGIKSIESRANSIGATIEIHAQIDVGFEFKLFLKNTNRMTTSCV